MISANTRAEYGQLAATMDTEGRIVPDHFLETP
jgi:hypothetical protein